MALKSYGVWVKEGSLYFNESDIQIPRTSKSGAAIALWCR